MARSRTPVSKRKPRRKKTAPQKRQRMDGIPVQAMSVDQFCFANNFGRDLFYAMLKKGEAPECLMVGKRRLISFEAAARWRAKREIAANTEATEATEVVAA